MQYLVLSQTDLKVSRVCLGTMTFGKQTEESVAERMVARCLDAGINFFDTANVYNAGASEEILGRILQGRREKVIVASKVGGLAGKAASGPRLGRGQIVAEVEKSLKRLRTDYLDLYYLHQPDYATPVEETLAALDELVRDGKIRYPATSNFAAWQVAELLHLAEQHGFRPAATAQQMYNLLGRRLEPEFVPMAKARRIPIVAYNPLAGGLLTGKHRPGTPAAGTRFDGNKQYQMRYWSDSNFAAVELLEEIASSCERSLIELSLSWLLNHTATDCVILGASRMEHLDQNLAACESGPLPPDVLPRLDKVWAGVGGIAPLYNR